MSTHHSPKSRALAWCVQVPSLQPTSRRSSSSHSQRRALLPRRFGPQHLLHRTHPISIPFKYCAHHTVPKVLHISVNCNFPTTPRPRLPLTPPFIQPSTASHIASSFLATSRSSTTFVSASSTIPCSLRKLSESHCSLRAVASCCILQSPIGTCPRSECLPLLRFQYSKLSVCLSTLSVAMSASSKTNVTSLVI